jgi:carboxyl-terminal processing protease
MRSFSAVRPRLYAAALCAIVSASAAVAALSACRSKTSNAGPPSASAIEADSSARAAASAVLASLPKDDLAESPRDAREPALAQAARYLLSSQHVSRRPIDDALSREAFAEFVEELDGAKALLLASDVEKLRRYETSLDDQLEAGDLVVARKGVALLGQRRQLVAQLVAELLSKPLPPPAPGEVLETDPKKRSYCASEAELRNRWRGTLATQIHERVHEMEQLLAARDKPSADGKPLDDAAKRALESIPPTAEGREQKARTELATRYETRFRRLAAAPSIEAAQLFLGAITSVYDPHTAYLAPSDKANFDIQMSGKLEGIGAALREQDHYIVVDELIPGGASWQQGKLRAGDLILAVAQTDQPAVDVVDMPIDKVVSMIRGKKGTAVTLTIKKPDARIESITITRDVIKIEATYARGAVLDLGPKSDSVGYVYLPGFYGDMGNGGRGERNATDDVRALLDTFRQRKLDSVVIDLRGNGGGLLAHARDISGLFLDKGPIVQTRDAEGEVEVLSDEDPSVSFSGDVVVLVDRFSASASEILAGALQDYGRAVVVGTGPTHGKGTVQGVFDLDRIARAASPDPLGVIKLTVEQYYRVSGGSTQLRGVVPDVLLPDPASYVEGGERSLPHAIAWSTIDEARYSRLSPAWSTGDLAAKSRARVASHPTFAKVEAFAKLVRKLREDSTEPLDERAWRDKKAASKASLDAEDPKLKDRAPALSVEALREKGTPAPTDPVVKKKLDAWQDELARDPWLEESLRVVDDMRAVRKRP